MIYRIVEHTYGSNGKCIKKVETDEEGNECTVEERTYDTEGREATFKSYNYGRAYADLYYEYEDTEDGGYKKKTMSRNNGNAFMSVETTYDSEGNVLEYINYDENGKVEETVTYTYTRI